MIALAVLVAGAPLSAVAVTAVKTTTVLVYSSPTAVSGSINAGFTVYIGDDISAVVSPIKSAFFTATGVYTGSGSVAFSVNGVGTTSFAMPNVGSTPTPFKLLYKDTGQIAPATAGSFAYTLNVLPTGVTLSGFGVELSVTYEYTQSGCPDGSYTNEKIKTQEQFAYASPTAVNGAINAPVAVYIGDDISGITSPIKSAHFTVSGVYTGGGSYAFTIDGDGATTKSFALPNVGSVPTPFSLKYKDETGKIAPTTAGAYAYTLALVPTGVTISGLGVTLTVTFQHHPPTCGGYPATGELTSTTFDTTGAADGPAYNSILWKGQLGGPANTIGRVRFQFASSDSSAGPWNFIGGSTCQASEWWDPGDDDVAVELNCPTQLNNKRYFRYKVQICSVNCVAAGVFTPTVNDIVVSWSP